MFASQPHLLSNRRFLVGAIPAAVFALTLLTVNLFGLGGDKFIFAFNNFINFPLALLVVAAAASAQRLMQAERRSRLLWMGLLLGWILWALAEAIWLGYMVFNQEAPYPSFADVFWLLGYLPMSAGLTLRAQTMPARQNPLQTLVALLITSVTALLVVLFLFIPVLQNLSAQEILANVPNFLYPLADLFLISVVWRLLFIYEEGDYGAAWKLLLLGFAAIALSDLVYTFAALREVYYPDMRANFLSRFIDSVYSLSYIFWFLGAHALLSQRKIEERQPAIEEARPPKVRIVRTYGHILAYTQSDDSVLEVSSNFGNFFREEKVVGKSLAEALTISEPTARLILDKIRAEGKIADFPVQIRNLSGAAQEVKISGLAINNSQKGYMGANLLLRTRVADKSFDEPLDSSSRAMIRFLLERSGSSNKSEIGQFLADYYTAYLRALLEVASRQGGATLVQALIDTLNQTAQAQGWQIQLNPQTILPDNAEYTLETLREALPALLESGKKFISDVTDPSLVEARMEEVSSRIGAAIHRDVERYLKEGSEVPLADRRERAH